MKKEPLWPRGPIRTVQTGRTVRKLTDWEILQGVIAKVHKKYPALRMMQIFYGLYDDSHYVTDAELTTELKKVYEIS